MIVALVVALLLSGMPAVQDGTPAPVWRDDPNLAPTLTDPAARTRMNAEISAAIEAIAERYEVDSSMVEYEAARSREEAARLNYEAEGSRREEAETAAERERQAWQAQVDALRSGPAPDAATPPPVDARTRPGPR